MNSRMVKTLAITGVAGVALFLSSGCGGGSETTYADQPAPPRRSFEILSAYGDWVAIAQFGEVWRPRVGYDWEPYTDGHWRWTDQGWAWVSYEPFGWVVYHYGSWMYEPNFGWLWVPGYEWAPARVHWIQYGDYVGWAPEPPPGGVLVEPEQDLDFQTWIVVPAARLTRQDVKTYRTRGPNARTVRTLPVKERRAPDVRIIEDAEQTRLDPMPIETDHVDAGGRQLLRLRLPPDEDAVVHSHEGDAGKEVTPPEKRKEEKGRGTEIVPPEKKRPTGKEPTGTGTGAPTSVTPPAGGGNHEKIDLPPAKKKPAARSGKETPGAGKPTKKQNPPQEKKAPKNDKEGDKETPKKKIDQTS